jgi:hypothetical protein
MGTQMFYYWTNSGLTNAVLANKIQFLTPSLKDSVLSCVL